MQPPRDAALISITDPGRALAQLRPGWTDVLRIAFDDIDPVDYPDEDDSLQAITDEQAIALSRFILLNATRCCRLVVHCRYGVSRSAAVAKAAAQHLALPFPPAYADANAFVYRAVLWALREVRSEC